MLTRLERNDAGLLLEPIQRIAQFGVWLARRAPVLTIQLSDEFFHLLDEPPGEHRTVPMHWLERIHPEDRPIVVDTLRRTLPGLEAFTLEFRTVRPDGGQRWLHVRAQSVVDPEGWPAQLGIMQDLTERRSVQDALRMTEQRLRTLVESAPEAIVVIDVARNSLYDFNDNACVLWGCGREVMARIGLGELAPSLQPDGQSSVLTLRSRLHETLLGAKPTFEWTLRTATGELVPTEVRLVRLPDAYRYLVRASVTDITARKRAEATLRELEERLARAERLQAIGQLAGGIAHDFNNTLSVILALADMVHGALPGDSPLRDDVRQIAHAAQRGASLTRQLLAFGGKMVLQPRVVDLNDMLRELGRMLRPTVGARVALSIVTHPRPCRVRVDPEQFERVLVNLVLNARDAVEGSGGSVHVESELVQLSEPLRSVDGEIAPGLWVRVTVRDTGVGMPPELIARIFEPYFTTKPAGRGTGLGLAMVFGLVHQSGGQLVVASAQGHGSEFSVYLPQSLARPSQPPETLLESTFDVLTPASALTVLLVEDEPLVRQVARRVLQRTGYHVLEADDPDTALAISAAHQGQIDLLLTDMAMPSMDGRELADRLALTRPALRVLYMSGHPRDAEKLEGRPFLAKPFLPAALLQAVRTALASVPTRPA